MRCYLFNGFPEGFAGRILTIIVRPGVASPVIRCYNSHSSILRTEGLTVWRVIRGWSPWVTRHSFLYYASLTFCWALVLLPSEYISPLGNKKSRLLGNYFYAFDKKIS